MRRRLAALAVALAAGAGLVLWGLADPRVALQGWLVATVAWLGVPLGSLVLLMIHALTRGRWGEAYRPVLLPAACLVGLAAAALLPLVADLPGVFAWAGRPDAAPPGVADLYLNAPAVLVRAAVAFAGWILLSRLVAARGSTLSAGLGLAFTALAISAIAIDWELSVEPGYPSSAFPALFATEKVLTALAACAVAMPAGAGARDRADLAGLLIAGLLGVVYLAFMTYLVAWYGNLPDKAAWYLRRSGEGWILLLAGAGLVGALLPLAMLMSARVRQSAAALRAVGALVLAGIVLHTAWLIAPAFGWPCLGPAAIGLAALGGLSVALEGAPAKARGVAHAW